jgi:hypothetical protein
MIKFLAIIAFCVNGKCAFWVDSETPYYTEEECQMVVVKTMGEMVAQGLNPDEMLPACIPTKFYKKEI